MHCILLFISVYLNICGSVKILSNFEIWTILNPQIISMMLAPWLYMYLNHIPLRAWAVVCYVDQAVQSLEIVTSTVPTLSLYTNRLLGNKAAKT